MDGAPYVRPASRGHRAMVRCLHALGCPWGARQPGRLVFSQAVRGGAPIPVVHLIRRNGCPLDWEDAARTAVGDTPDPWVMALVGNEDATARSKRHAREEQRRQEEERQRLARMTVKERAAHEEQQRLERQQRKEAQRQQWKEEERQLFRTARELTREMRDDFRKNWFFHAISGFM